MEKLPKKLNPESKPEIKWERQSGLVRIVGLEEDKEQEVLALSGYLFEQEQEKKGGEIEKTPEQKEAIAFLNRELPRFLERYGVQPIAISEDKVHLLPENYFEKNVGGHYYPVLNSIWVKDIKGKPLLAFAKGLAHESLHLNSFQSAEAAEKGGQPVFVRLRREGFKIHKAGKKDEVYFRDLDEAIVEELTKRFCREFLKKSPLFKKDLEEISEVEKIDLISQMGEVAYISMIEKDGHAQATLHFYSYPEERKKLKALIAELYEKNKSEFSSEEEVFNLFVQAALTGRLLPIARLVEKTYGQGSFRRLDKSFQTGEDNKTRK